MARQPLSLKIGISGVRGIVGESLTPQLITSFAAAFGTYCGGGAVLIGTDTRPSRRMASLAAVAGLLSVGCSPVDLGIVPVPILPLAIRERKAAGGICITASHNPMEWNALKFFGADGVVLRPNQFEELLDLYHQGTYPRVEAQAIAEVRADQAALLEHREAVLRAVDGDAIRARRFKAAVDCCNGAASLVAPDFLRALGCEVAELHCDPEAGFPRHPEPTAESLAELCRRVREAGADLGLALDADADRLALVSERGEPLGEECTLALAVRHVLGRRPGPVVVNASTSRMIDDIAAEFGCPVHRTRVGEVHVVEKMLECGAPIGGEGTGGVIAPAVNPCRDSFVGMAFILESMAREGCAIGELRRRLPAYVMVREKISCRPRDVAPALRLLRYLYRQEKIDLTDGVKVLWPDRWLHVRGSNTEPILRLTAEARTEEEARGLVRGIQEYLR
ncbi:MAG: phosphoglucosamine mutase [Planctomycetes bacterium]|nr:phosphoglucosamine mutase [Planctomycetota bacterium]